ncbi:hypothetical protein N8071_00470 [bacterium]|nr:hypothetical protein [bacterium]
MIRAGMIFGLAAYLLGAAPAANAQTLTEKIEALDALQAFADGYCGKVPLESESTAVSGSLKAKVEIDGLIRSLIDAGIVGEGEIERLKTSGVLQDQLARALDDNLRCRERLFEGLKSELLPAPGRTARRFTMLYDGSITIHGNPGRYQYGFVKGGLHRLSGYFSVDPSVIWAQGPNITMHAIDPADASTRLDLRADQVFRRTADGEDEETWLALTDFLDQNAGRTVRLFVEFDDGDDRLRW